MPESELPGPMTVTALAFHRASGSFNAQLTDVGVYLGIAGSGELGPEFQKNALSRTLVLEAEGLSLVADENGRILLPLDEPYDYTGGDLLLECRFGRVSGMMYVFGWTASGKRYLSSGDPAAGRGRVFENVPMITLVSH